eukprot:TRINITY_DN12985_c0_g1_i2.p2 TRINITY_DN12985_c0_g1~~TRINITY_DN12985_c0_g1_i2.p2  ORF type:complete len:192 (+),score=30.99 TRINITY_DN12985_c0_g1_i2:199-774(+)
MEQQQKDVEELGSSGKEEQSFRFPVIQSQQPELDKIQPLTAGSTVVLASPQSATGQIIAADPEPVEIDSQAEKQGKIPLEKGYSQMDWMRLTKTHKDLAGLNGASIRRNISIAEIRQHQTESDGWIIVRGKVYNISPYLKFHPGGIRILKPSLGRDGTSLFNKYHPWVNVDALLEKLFIGLVDQQKPEDYL